MRTGSSSPPTAPLVRLEGVTPHPGWWFSRRCAGGCCGVARGT